MKMPHLRRGWRDVALFGILMSWAACGTDRSMSAVAGPDGRTMVAVEAGTDTSAVELGGDHADEVDTREDIRDDTPVDDRGGAGGGSDQGGAGHQGATDGGTGGVGGTDGGPPEPDTGAAGAAGVGGSEAGAGGTDGGDADGEVASGTGGDAGVDVPESGPTDSGDAPVDAVGCELPLRTCHGLCVDTSNDDHNCGEACLDCPFGRSCQSGLCF